MQSKSSVHESDLAICDKCSAEIPCNQLSQGTNVYLQKTCSIHGSQQTILSTDGDYWQLCCEKRKQNDLGVSQESVHMLILEVIDECDLSCPTCIAASTVGSGNARPRTVLISRVERLVSKVGKLPLIMVSGGEPTLHPEILEILSDLSEYADQVMLITNGVLISSDANFTDSLSKLGNTFQVYLQFDSTNPNVLIDLRGKDYTEVRQGALKQLDKHNVATTLVCVVKRGQNETELADIVKLASRFKNIVGVTFQPIRASGRHHDFNYEVNSITLSEVRKQLITDLKIMDKDMVPHPLNPERISIGYFLTDSLIMESITEAIFTNYASLSECPLYFKLNEIDKKYSGRSVLRITIISFLDKFDYSRKFSQQGGIMFLTDTEEVLPIDQHYLPLLVKNHPITFND